MKAKRTAAVALVAMGMWASAIAAEPKLDQLLVYGDDFAFAVKEPSEWHGDTDNAGKYGANVIFYRTGESPEGAKTLIRVRVGAKTDENTADDVAYDMKGYAKQYPGIQVVDCEVGHPNYRVFAKLFKLPKRFHEYVVYINPGPQDSHLLSSAMNTGKQLASEAELAAFKEVISSLAMLSGDKVRP